MKSRNLILFFIFPTIYTLASPENVNITFPSFSLRNVTLLGDSYLRDGDVGLTRELTVPSSSAGSAIYNTPIPFFDPETNTTASFSTRFAFSVNNVNSASFGDGLTFFLSPNDRTLGSSGEYLGLVNSSQLTKNRFVAVEFDTRLDLHLGDPDDNHVGLDIDSLVSIKTATLLSAKIDLKSGNAITAWIDYSGDRKKMEVFSSYSTVKPESPVLAVDIDLSDHLTDFLYLGFSASTEGSTERHYIHNWSFRTFGFQPAGNHNTTQNSSIPSGDRHHKSLGLALGIGCPSAVFASLLVFAFASLNRAKNHNHPKAEVVAGPRQFTYKELKSATKGFDQSKILGHGAFGTVYKAYFVDSGTISAVKRSNSKHTHEGKSEFLSELSIIARLRHKNLVQLQGWCAEKGELLLVYEFMPNGSLDHMLHQDPAKRNPLKWCYRYNIAVGLASALTHLHQECEQQVIHRDIKTSNIMIDAGYNGRLGDFGLARLLDHDKSPVSTLTAGTMGYLAPEYLQYGKATEKTDVFSYGVVILELACGRRPIEREGEGQRMVNLVDWVWKLHSEGRIVQAADAKLRGEFDEARMKRFLVVGLSCANPDSAERPSMRRVLQILKNEADPFVVPRKKPSLTFSNSIPLSIDEIVSEFESCGLEDSRS